MGQTITASFGLDINPLKKGFEKAVDLGKDAARTIREHVTGFITSPLTAISAGIGGFFTYEAFKSGIEGVYEAGVQMNNLHNQTGMTVGSIATLKGIFSQADTSSDNLGESIGKMQRNLFTAARVGGAAGSALRLLKLDVDDLIKLKPEDQFVAIGKAIAALNTPLARASAAQKIFGNGSQELIPVFAALGGVDFGNLSQKAAIMQKDAERFAEVTAAFHRARGQLQNVFVGMADSLAPTLAALGGLLSKRNALEFGITLGAGIRTATQFFVGAFQNPQMIGMLVAGATKLGFATSLNFLASGLIRAGLSFTEGLLNGFDVAIRAFRAGLEMAVEGVMGGLKRLLENSATGLGDIGKALGLDKLFSSLASGLPDGRASFASYFKDQKPTSAADGAGLVSALSEAFKVLSPDMFGAAGLKSALSAVATVTTVLGSMTLSEKKEQSKQTLPGGLGHLTNNGGILGATMANANAFAERFSAGFVSRVVNRDGTTNEMGGLARGAYARSPLLTIGERRAFEDQAVARGDQRSAGIGAFGAVRSGDTARRKEAERERLLQKQGQERGNEILEGILGTLKEGLIDE